MANLRTKLLAPPLLLLFNKKNENKNFNKKTQKNNLQQQQNHRKPTFLPHSSCSSSLWILTAQGTLLRCVPTLNKFFWASFSLFGFLCKTWWDTLLCFPPSLRPILVIREAWEMLMRGRRKEAMARSEEGRRHPTMVGLRGALLPAGPQSRQPPSSQGRHLSSNFCLLLIPTHTYYSPALLIPSPITHKMPTLYMFFNPLILDED